MRFLEQCPYITPCGYCSRLGKECKESRKKPKPNEMQKNGKFLKAGEENADSES